MDHGGGTTVYKDNGNLGRQLNPDNGGEEYH